ncbi:relaxase/mobilization nuclease domain-containing protein [Sphingobacterium rhinopitheci]|nr:relaxase/mobilization nuclease domain-containing protein [Sphingobacterium rhinopitheci]
MHQYLFVKHNDTKNLHYYFIINKVDLDGKKLNIGFDGKKE